ncbi:hypothetical protein TNCV_4776841 [Trichonephila clavipes]|nr:hypothetical protein TNCV_4776841 [Trichonephila clavipes]
MQKTVNDDEIVTSVPEESDPVDDETGEDEDNTTKVARVHQMLTRFLLSGFICCMDRIRYVSERCPIPIDSDKRHSTVFNIENMRNGYKGKVL